MQSNKKKYLACTLEALQESQSFGIEITINTSIIQCFLIYHDNCVYSYLNRCPHTGVTLEWVPNQFLDKNHEFIQCATHGALFDIKNGQCLRGPCVGDQLQIIENNVQDGNIYLIM